MGKRPKAFLIDSVIVIDHLNGIEAATEFLGSAAGTGMVSVITRAEVLSGVARSDLSIVKRLLDRFRALEITTTVADRAARLRRRNGWKLPDALQAALAIERVQLAQQSQQAEADQQEGQEHLKEGETPPCRSHGGKAGTPQSPGCNPIAAEPSEMLRELYALCPTPYALPYALR